MSKPATTPSRRHRLEVRVHTRPRRAHPASGGSGGHNGHRVRARHGDVARQARCTTTPGSGSVERSVRSLHRRTRQARQTGARTRQAVQAKSETPGGVNLAGLRLERLSSDHDIAAFDSGNDELDGWLQRHALAAQQMDSARTFVLVRDTRVVGYFSLTMGSVLREDAPAKLVRGLPAYPVGMVLLRATRDRRLRAGRRTRRTSAHRGAAQSRRRQRSCCGAARRCRRHRRRSRGVLPTPWVRPRAWARVPALPENEGHPSELAVGDNRPRPRRGLAITQSS